MQFPDDSLTSQSTSGYALFAFEVGVNGGIGTATEDSAIGVQSFLANGPGKATFTGR
ncbi:MAG: hypothetical protein KTU85_02925 [Acidimicrobiia bacterium]|nr:hypothetical protein [Acidimicrobiia bacterium]MCY4458691.1 hypothetical protein [Acidimicrobiaceae bacterium]